MAQDYVLQLKNIDKSFDGETILENFNLNVKKKEFVTLLGPSGCGKTTTLRLIGGFEEPEAGSILYNGEDITHVPPHKRNINTVFQKYSLFMHMNIYENIAFGLKIKNTPKHIIDEKVKNALKTVNLEGYEMRKPDSLSGGQQQRIAIARAIVNEPDILLLDEPLGALDLKLRQELQLELKALQKKMGITFIYVTHDQEEALTMSDTIVVMSKGKIQQIGTPTDVYNEPENAFVAQFIGHSNIFDATFIKDKLVKFEDREFECVDTGFGEGEEVEVVLRPEDIKLSAPQDGQVKGVVTSVCFKGVHYDMMIESADGYKWQVQSTIGAQVGQNVGMSVAPFDIHVMKKTVHEDITPEENE